MPSRTERSVNLQVAGRSLAAVLHETDGDALVVFCHGFRGEKSGPNRTFVRAARSLADRGISSLRFDQYGSGDSAGDFLESRFTQWVGAIAALAHEQRELGRRVALFGQSMGGSAVLCAAATAPVEALVAAAKPADRVDVFDGYPHSAWTYDQAEDVIARRVDFLTTHLGAPSSDV